MLSTGSAGILGNLLDQALSLVAIFTTAGMVEALLYGMHLILFCICVGLFLRNRGSTQSFLLISAAVMFFLSTADIAITFRIASYVMPRFTEPKIAGITTKLVQTKNSIFVINNFVADLILLYRSWMVWNRSKYVLAGCSLLVLADTIWGFLGMGPTLRLLSPLPNRFAPVYIWSIFAINVVLVLVTITRIYWISREAKRLVGNKRTSPYHTAIAILMQSSLIYSICLLLYILLPATDPYRVVMILMCMRIVAIMPTLLIVQVGMGTVIREMNDPVPSTMSKFEVRSNNIVLSTVRSSIMLHENQRRGTVFPPSLHDEEAAGSSQSIELTNVSKTKTATSEDRRPSIDCTHHTSTTQ